MVMASKTCFESRSEFTRPKKLTPEIVVRQFTPMIMGLIRKFKIQNQSDEDLFNSILVVMITPSKTFGTSFLDRYDRDKAYASTYITTMVMNYLKGAYRSDKREEAVFQKFVANPETGVKEPVKIENTLAAEDAYESVEERVATQTLLRTLRTKKNTDFYSRSPKGKPRTTFRAVMLMLLKGLSIVEIAEEFGVSQVEIRRRFGLLASDPKLRRIAEDYGWRFPQERAG